MCNVERSFIRLGSILVVAAALCASTGQAKSLYLIADINDSPTPIHAYDIQPSAALIAFQQEREVPAFGGGAVGLAIDGAAKRLFITYEHSNVIQFVDATTFANLGTATVAGATNLAGIVVDEGKHKVYAIERDTNLLYVYAWSAATNALTLEIAAKPLSGVAHAYGLALDETRSRLYIGDVGSAGPLPTEAPLIIRYFDTAEWSLAGSLSLPAGTQPPTAIAVDSQRNAIFTGNANSALGSLGELVKYDVATQTTSSYTLPQLAPGTIDNNVIGIAVDEESGNVYVTTGSELGGGSDTLLVFDRELALLKSAPVTTKLGTHGNPTGIVVAPYNIGFNPLNFTITAAPDPVPRGANLTYRLCYDNLYNDVPFANATITNELPPGTTFVSASASATHANAQVTWNLGAIAAEAAEACQVLVVKVTAPAGHELVDEATISGTIGEETIPTTQSVKTQIAQLNPLLLTLDDGVDAIVTGSDITFSVCYANTANMTDIGNVVIAGVLPPGTSFVSLTGNGVFDGTQIRWNIGSVAANAPALCESLVLHATAAGGEAIAVSLAITGAGAESASATHTTPVVANLTALGISIDDTIEQVETGGSLTFQVCFDNAQNAFDVNDVVIMGPVPSGSSFVSASGGGALSGTDIVWNEGNVLAHAPVKCHELSVRAVAPGGARVSAQMTINGTGAPSASATHSTDVVAAPEPPPPPPPPREDASASGKGGGGGSVGFDVLLALGLLMLVKFRSASACESMCCSSCERPFPCDSGGRTGRGQFRCIITASLAFLALATPLHAQDDASGWYLGTKFGRVDVDASARAVEADLARRGHDVDVSLDTSDSAWSVFIGRRFNRYFALEAAYSDLGEVTSSIHGSVPSLAQFAADLPRVHPYSIDGYSLAATAGMPIGNAWLYAKAGVMRWQSNEEARVGTARVEIRADGTDALYGVGLQYAWTQRWAARAEWEHYDTNRNDVNLTSIALTYRFR